MYFLLKLLLFGIKFKSEETRLHIKPNQKVNIEFDSARVISIDVTDCSKNFSIVTCSSCGGINRIIEGERAVCDYCGKKLDI